MRAIGERTAAMIRKTPDGEPLCAVIDLRWMRPGDAGGIETLSRAFLAHLLASDRVNRYTVLAPAAVRGELDVRGHANVRVVAADGPRLYARAAALRAARLLRGGRRALER